jgi:hypothetical protein
MRSAILLVVAGTALVQAAHLKGTAYVHNHGASGARALNLVHPCSGGRVRPQQPGSCERCRQWKLSRSALVSAFGHGACSTASSLWCRTVTVTASG